ncbi:hypothetical protein JCM10212_006012 [Sporobolomyces blumeae]
MSSTSPASHSTPPSGKPRASKLFTKVACAGCRAIKVKCRLRSGELPTGDEGETCVRCERLAIPCEYKSATRRGRKPKSLLAAEAAASIAATSPSEHSGTGPHDAMEYDRSPELERQPAPTAAAPRQPLYSLPPVASTSAAPHSAPFAYLPPPPSSSSSSSLLSPHLPQPPVFHAPPPQAPSHPGPPQASFAPPQRPRSLSSQTSSFSQSHGGGGSIRSPGEMPSPAPAGAQLNYTGATSFASAAEAKVSSFASSSRPSPGTAPQSTPTHPDPIDLHVLSPLEAAQLFELFHSRLNCFIILLDRHLHTSEYVRATSTVLFSAVLAVSAKFFRPDLYPSLLMSAQQLVVRGTGSAEVDIGLIQSCLLLVYWKEPLDASAWIRIGFALRAAYQLGLHAKRKASLPQDEHEARLILNRERTWITCVCFDASYQLMNDAGTAYQTRMVTTHDIDIEAWLVETRPYDCPDDFEQGASMGLVRVAALFPSIATAPSKAVAHSLANHCNEVLASIYQKYLDESSPTYQQLGTLAQHKIRFHCLTASLSVGKSCLIAAGVEDDLVLASVISRCGQLVECFEDLTAGSSPVFIYAQDVLSVSLMSVGEMLGKLFPQVGPAVQTTIVDYIYRIYNASASAAAGNPDSVPAYVSRFYRAVLRAIHPHAFGSSPPTRAASPRGGTTGAGETVAGQGTVASSSSSSSNAMPHPFHQLSDGAQQELLVPDMDALVTSLRNDGSYWDSLFPGQSSWAWLDCALAAPDQYLPSLT